MIKSHRDLLFVSKICSKIGFPRTPFLILRFVRAPEYRARRPGGSTGKFGPLASPPLRAARGPRSLWTTGTTK